MRLVLVALLLSSAARADELPPATYAAVTCGEDSTPPGDLVALPGGAIVEGKPLEAMGDLVGAGKAPPAKATKRAEGRGLFDGWCTAQVTVKAGKQVLSLAVSGVGELTGLGSDKLAVDAMMIARPVADKDAAKLPAPAAVTGADDGEDWMKTLTTGLATPEKQSALWAPKRDDLILVGSAPGELFKGAAAKTTLAKWKLALALTGGLRTGTVKGRSELAYVYSNVVATPVKGGAPVTYRGFFVLLADHAGDPEEKRPEHDSYHLVLAHFAR